MLADFCEHVFCLDACCCFRADSASPRSLYRQVTAAAAPAGREQLAERLFAALHERHRELAGRLTGMLLELPEHELAALLADPERLSMRTEQALRALGR